MDITYTKVGDYYYPNLAVPEQPKKHIGAYGQLRKHYLKNYRPAAYSAMMIKGTLLEHLAEVNELCHGEISKRIKAMAEAQSITEELKKKDQMKWVGLMNNIEHSVREEVLREFVYI